MREEDKLRSLLEEDKPITRITKHVEPAETRYYSLGQYPASSKEPTFDWSAPTKEEIDQMGVSFSRVDVEDEPQYMMVAICHNYGTVSKSIDVTIWRIEDAPKG
ncbi:hypothetical protein HUT19_07620 [Streptomyces sp. NA02950]|uniref:hypothetical protein n=1 Tax=Streptomyces sp. NA02950 TaxID=2742137 RepID=UPI001591D3D4|nr:hypothetical protein [Streptomyces sp. NA02950]QKV91640.1 hypothetical protein HUT19_07620 [Streptomyces sp. NA02950]